MSVIQLIDELILYKESHKLREQDATYDKQLEWYTFLLRANLLEIVIEEGIIVGFAECVYLNKIPNSLEALPRYPEHGKVLFVCNAAANNRKTLFKLKTIICRKHKARHAIVWHRKRNNRMVVIGRKYEHNKTVVADNL